MFLFVFDIDGTLTDSVALHEICYLQALSELGITEVDTNWDSYAHFTDSWVFAEVFLRNFGRSPNKNERDEFASTSSRCFDKIADEQPFREIPGARTFLKRLQSDMKTGFAFATGSFRQPAMKKLDMIGLEVPSELVVTASEFETREDIVLHAISAARSYFTVPEFEHVILLGDAHCDLVTARNLGLRFIGIGRGQAAENLKAEGAWKVFPNLLTDGIIASITGQESSR
jgi:phosphoglycolate phosphatase-like HAD superfamily hydrolase